MDIKCPHCGAVYEVELRELGHRVKCELCGRNFVIGEDHSSPQAISSIKPQYASLRRIETRRPSKEGGNTAHHYGRQEKAANVQSSCRKQVEVHNTYRDTHFISSWLIKFAYWAACLFLGVVTITVLIKLSCAKMKDEYTWILMGCCGVFAFVCWFKIRLWYEKKILEFESLKHQRQSRDVQEQTFEDQQQTLDVQRQILEVLKNVKRDGGI